jgi:rubrerythrin
VRLGEALSPAARRAVAEAWSFRVGVEAAATVQFERLAAGLLAVSAPDRLVEAAQSASREEQVHGTLCAELAEAYGAPPVAALPEPPLLAPANLVGLEALAYAMVAHCCVAETESVSTLSELIKEAQSPLVRRTLVAIARDEVGHAQLGWAFVAWAARVGPLSFLAPLLPRMVTPGAAPLFEPALAAEEDPLLIEHGVLPLPKRREVFCAALQEVVLPGLARAGVDGRPARAWLAGQRQRL